MLLVALMFGPQDFVVGQQVLDCSYIHAELRWTMLLATS